MKLREYYCHNFVAEMPVKNLHLTLMAPFFIKENSSEKEIIEKVSKIIFKEFISKFTSLGCFEQKGRKILYARAELENEFLKLAERVREVLINLVEMDLSPYTDSIVPSFKAHVTLDYDFKDVVPENFLEISFPVEKMVIFKEENGEWNIIT